MTDVQIKHDQARKRAIVSLALILALFFSAGLVFFIVGTMTNSEPYKVGVARARTNPDAVALLGEPINGDWYALGRISGGAESAANLRIPVKGSRAEGVVYLKGSTVHGKWHFDFLTLKSAGREINLLSSSD